MEQNEFEAKLKEQLEEVKSHITPRSVARTIVKQVASHSVGFVAATLVKTYCPTESKKEQLQLTVGGYVIGHMAGGAAGDWAVRELDDAIDFVLKVIGKAKDLDDKPKEQIEEVQTTEAPTE